jgi:uracil-xanthine permease
MVTSVGKRDTEVLPYPKKIPGIIYPEDTLPPLRNMLGGAQHVVAMFGATVLAPLLMGFDPNVCVLFSGLATILFFLFVGGAIPSYLGSSFAFISAVIAATGYSGSGANPNISIALGGIVAAGAIYFAVGAVVAIFGYRWLERLMPPEVTGAIVAIIGLNLASIAVGDLRGGALNTIFGLATVTIIVLSAVHGPGFLARIPILIGGGLSYLLYFFACNIMSWGQAIDFSGVAGAAWIGVPRFSAPVFQGTAIILIAPTALVLVAENLGHVRAIGAMTGRNLDPYLGRAFMADGLSTLLSGFAGGTGVTTYAENIGVMSITKNYSSFTVLVAGIFAVCLGLSPKFGEAIKTIPIPIIGGLSLVLFGLITATAGRIWVDNKVDFTQSRNLLVVGISVVMGAGDLKVQFTTPFGEIVFGGIATATFSAIVLYHVIARPKRDAGPLAGG